MSTVQSVSVDRARLNNAVHDGHGMRISQSTFDEVVRENVDDFGMEMAEACADAVAQFEAQGVDLSNICCEPGAAAADAGGADGAAEGETGAPAEDPPIIAVSKALVQSADDAPLEEVYATVQKLLVELAEGGKAPIVAGSHGAVQALVVALLRLLDASKADAADEGGDDDDNDDNADGVDDNKDGIAAASGAAAVPDADGAGEGARPLGRVMATVRAISLCMVVPYNREVLGEDGLGALLRVAEQHGANPTACGRSLLALARACVKDENNRQDLVERGAVPAVVDCLRRHGAAAEPTRAHHRAVRGACDATVALTLGDDPRAALTKSHEHIRLLAHEGAIEALCAIAHTAFVRELPTAAAVLSALSKIAARNDLCERIVALGGLDAVVALHAAHGGDAKFARAACALIKAVSGNDEARALICNGPALDVVLGTLSVHSEDAPACLEACGALNSAALRNGANAAIIMSRGGGTMLLQALQDHPDVPGVQRYGCSGIRNLVVRNREFAKAFLDEGAEPLLRAAMAKHQTAAAHAKGALRDLGCSVVFNEEWKGVNGDLKR